MGAAEGPSAPKQEELELSFEELLLEVSSVTHGGPLENVTNDDKRFVKAHLKCL